MALVPFTSVDEVLVALGGSMTEAERRRFEARAELDALVALRRADDDAKSPDRIVRPVDAWRPLLDQVAAGAAAPGASAASAWRA